MFESVQNKDEDCVRLMAGMDKFFHPTYGFCYSFNFRGSNGTGRQTGFNGGFFGLQLWINLETEYSMRVLCSTL